MAEPEDKKRLKLASEELPAPSPNPEGNPRQRTLKRLGCLTGVAATGAVVGGYLFSQSDNGGVIGGYGVVDPMPPPARCLGLAATLRATATWSGPDTILVVFDAPSALGASYASLKPIGAEEVTAWDIHSDRAEVTLKVSETKEIVQFAVFAICNPDDAGMGGSDPVWTKVTISKRAAPPSGAGRGPAAPPPTLSVQLSDQRDYSVP